MTYKRSLSSFVFAISIVPLFAYILPPKGQSYHPVFDGSVTGRPSFVVSSSRVVSEFELPDEAPKRHRSSERDASSNPCADSNDLSDARKSRYKMEEEARSRFVTGDALHLLRQKVLGLKDELEEARREAAMQRVKELENAMIVAQQVDAEFVYGMALDRMLIEKESGSSEAIEHWKVEAMKARSVLPQFSLEGLWVGRYGDHGYELINVTYVGDTMVARKVTGEKKVPAGETSFTADLSVGRQDSRVSALEPIELGEEAAEQWGTRYLHRFHGSGQVAAEGYVNSQWMDGQLILVNEYFSFAWLPLGHQVFFGRPSAELTLKLLREAKLKKNIHAETDFLRRCMDETEILFDEMDVSDGPFRHHDQHDFYNQDGCFE